MKLAVFLLAVPVVAYFVTFKDGIPFTEVTRMMFDEEGKQDMAHMIVSGVYMEICAPNVWLNAWLSAVDFLLLPALLTVACKTPLISKIISQTQRLKFVF